MNKELELLLECLKGLRENMEDNLDTIKKITEGVETIL